MNVLAINPTAQELWFADFPHERTPRQMERMDKFTLRKWIIGNAVLKGWEYRSGTDLAKGWEYRSGTGLAGELIKDGCTVGVILQIDGVELLHRGQSKLLKTSL